MENIFLVFGWGSPIGIGIFLLCLAGMIFLLCLGGMIFLLSKAGKNSKKE